MLTLTLDKQTRILEAAHARFLNDGVCKTTMRDIAQDVGIAVSNVYLYFTAKRDLVLAIAERCRAEQAIVIEAVLADTDLPPVAKLEQLFTHKFDRIDTLRNVYPHGKELIAYLLQEFPDRQFTWNDKLFEAVQSIFTDGIAQGFFRMPDAAAATAMLKLITAQYFLPAPVVLPIAPEKDELLTIVRWFMSLYQVPAGALAHV